MFQFSDQHIEDYQTLGYTVFRGIVPPKLIDELREQCALGAIAARERGGANTQRFQPVSAFPVDLRPFEEFQNLPEIKEAVSRIVQGEFEFSGVDTLGVLLEPAEKPWCMHWHRDWRDNFVCAWHGECHFDGRTSTFERRFGDTNRFVGALRAHDGD